MFYFRPLTSRPLTQEQASGFRHIAAGLDANRDRLPYPLPPDLAGIHVYVDDGMTMQNGVMGLTRFPRPRELWVCPVIAEALAWTCGARWDNALAAGTVAHELTHLAMMRRPILYALRAVPFWRRWTLDAPAEANKEAAYDVMVEVNRDPQASAATRATTR